ncbi:MAG: YXWGXW repeat-containing protein [Burkholderiaceae bacterium]|nr:YXWGXW repeat-containing protein [Burkholderiaceae bacterium]
MLQLYRKILAHILGIVILGTSATVNAQPSSAAAHVGVRPPAARAERIPAGRAGHVWAPGYWGWNGRAHVWFGGHWEAERPGFRFIPASWVWVGGEWVFYPGYWDAVAPVVIVQPAPTEYIEQEPVAGPPDLDPNYWYYCRDPAGYYPYVQNCVAWQQVTPVPQ